MKIEQPKILVDADVIIHFIDGGRLDKIKDIFPGRLVFVDIVLEELLSFPDYMVTVGNFLTGIERIELKSKIECVEEYAKLIKFVGKGEAACMAIAKIEKKYLASSNLKDIKKYCEQNGIKIITTMDFLWEAMNTRTMAEQECDDFIQDVKKAGNKLPVDTIEEYVKKFKMVK